MLKTLSQHQFYYVENQFPFCIKPIEGCFFCFPQGDDNMVGGSEMPAVDPSGCTPVRFGDVDFL